MGIITPSYTWPGLLAEAISLQRECAKALAAQLWWKWSWWFLWVDVVSSSSESLVSTSPPHHNVFQQEGDRFTMVSAPQWWGQLDFQTICKNNIELFPRYWVYKAFPLSYTFQMRSQLSSLFLQDPANFNLIVDIQTDHSLHAWSSFVLNIVHWFSAVCEKKKSWIVRIEPWSAEP